MPRTPEEVIELIALIKELQGLLGSAGEEIFLSGFQRKRLVDAGVLLEGTGEWGKWGIEAVKTFKFTADEALGARVTAENLLTELTIEAGPLTPEAVEEQKAEAAAEQTPEAREEQATERVAEQDRIDLSVRLIDAENDVALAQEFVDSWVNTGLTGTELEEASKGRVTDGEIIKWQGDIDELQEFLDGLPKTDSISVEKFGDLNLTLTALRGKVGAIASEVGTRGDEQGGEATIEKVRELAKDNMSPNAETREAAAGNAFAAFRAAAKELGFNLALVPDEDIRDLASLGFSQGSVSLDLAKRARAGEFDTAEPEDDDPTIAGELRQLIEDKLTAKIAGSVTGANRSDPKEVSAEDRIFLALRFVTDAMNEMILEHPSKDAAEIRAAAQAFFSDRELFEGLVFGTPGPLNDPRLGELLDERFATPEALRDAKGFTDETGRQLQGMEVLSRREKGLPVYFDGKLEGTGGIGDGDGGKIVDATNKAVEVIGDAVSNGSLTFEEAQTLFTSIISAGEALIGPNGFIDIGIDTAQLITDLANAVSRGDHTVSELDAEGNAVNRTVKGLSVADAVRSLEGIVTTANTARTTVIEQERFDQQKRIEARGEIQRRREGRDTALAQLEEDERNFLAGNFELLSQNRNLPPPTPGAILGGADVIAALAQSAKAPVVAEPLPIGGPTPIPSGEEIFKRAVARAKAARPETTVEELLA